MAKRLSVKFVCNSCGNTSSSWTGRCQNCGEWNTIVEQIEATTSRIASAGNKLVPESVIKVVSKKQTRILTGITDVDAVLGGGLVSGSINLLAGQPGIGKSTLLLQIAYNAAKTRKVLYVSGEESSQQIGLRANRLGANKNSLMIANSTVANDIASTIIEGDYDIVVVDSIQTVTVNEVASAAGSVSQITNSTQLLSLAAKSTDTVLFLVGHVTKEGSIAGPKVLEHVVDVVLQLEGDHYGGLKILRSSKNRYGATTEAGIFEMSDNGLEAVKNPSATLLAERQISDGSIVHATMEGSRPLLVEIQALVNPTSYGYPKRTASGIDINRVNLLIAVLEKRTKLKLSDKDIYVNVVGGIKLTEPAADLAVCMTIASASRGMKLKKNAVVFGEVGLSGEVRHVPYLNKRVTEAKKLGFEGAIGPVDKNTKATDYLLQVRSVREALNSFLEA